MIGSDIATAVLPLIVGALAIGVLRQMRRWLPHAVTDRRTLHDAPVPRVGGLAIWAGWLPIALSQPPAVSGPWPVWLAAWLAVVAVSLADDWRGARVRTRLAVQVVAALAVAASIGTGARVTPAGTAAAVAVIAFVVLWGANLFNFMDGSDGLAATMALVGFGALAIALHRAGQPWSAHAALALATMPFLAVNRPRASMFMGDVGSVPLGFLAAALSIDGVLRGHWPPWFPVLVFLPFLLDASVTLARRTIRGERVWEPHRSHYYQRLHRLGFGHRGTWLAYGALMVTGAAVAIACLARAPSHGPLALGALCAVHAVLFATIDYHWNKQADPR